MASLPLSRRDYLKLATAGVLGTSMSGWLQALADDTAKNPQRKKACILLWMTGGPSQMDTFDLKPGHANGGPFQERQTSAPGLKISEHLPKIAQFGDKMAVIRGMSTKEGEHSSRHLPAAQRLPADRPDPISVNWFARLQGTRLRGGGIAELRRHRPVPPVQPGGLRAPVSLDRPTLRSSSATTASSSFQVCLDAANRNSQHAN